jgi:hypothetical protein
MAGSHIISSNSSSLITSSSNTAGNIHRTEQRRFAAARRLEIE